MAGFIPSICGLPDEMLLYIVEYLEIDDRFSFFSTCNRFRELCLGNRRVMKKVDLSRSIIRKDHIREVFKDKQIMQNIRELNLNNHRVLNWWMDQDLEEIIIPLCPQLEALHVLHCGTSLECLNCILQHAPNLTALSFSIMELTNEDIEFIKQDCESGNGICLENIRNLHIETFLSITHLQILKYLVLSHCKCLEELEICIWDLPQLELSEINLDLEFFNEQATPMTEILQNFHSLVVKTVGHHNMLYLNRPELTEFIISIVRRKSHETKWKRLYISPLTHSEALLQECDIDALTSVEVFSTVGAKSVDEQKVLFQMVNDSVVRRLRLHSQHSSKQFLKSIARTGGNALQSLSLFFRRETGLDAKIAFDTLFSVCGNIRELDLTGCHFEKNMCEPISKLKHLVKILLPYCAISPDNRYKHMKESNNKLLLLVENCPDVTEFDIHICVDYKCKHQRFLVDDDLLPIAKWTKLKSLKCFVFSLTTKQYKRTSMALQQKQDDNTFLKRVVENCKFLTMLRFGVKVCDRSYLSILESAKQLKHLGLFLPNIDLGSAAFWRLLSCATNLERLCIRGLDGRRLNASDVVEMLKCLPRLHVLHLHFCILGIKRLDDVYVSIMKAVEDEKSDRSSCFELLIKYERTVPGESVTNHILPVNISELCYYRPSLLFPDGSGGRSF